MKVSKKILAVLLVAMLILSFAACGGGQKATDGKVQITYAIWGAEEEAANTQLVADRFNASQDRIEVSVIPIPNETYIEKLNTMATAGELPDTAIMSEQGVIQWAEQGMLLDISDMYPEGSPKPLDSLAFMYDGKPVAYSAANEILLMYYNKDMFDAAGIEYPSTDYTKAYTWDEFVETAKLLTLDANGNNATSANFDKTNIVQYGCMVENWTWQLEVWCLSNGGGFYSADGSEVKINDPKSIEAIQKVADLYLSDCVAPLSAGLTDDGVSRSLIAGTCAMTTNGAWNIGTCLAAARDEGLNYGVAPLPTMGKTVTNCTGGPNVVFSQTEHPAEAMEWLSWYSQEANNWDNLIATGIWMPTLDSYYTDEALSKKWLENPNFPEYDEVKPVLVDYTRDCSVSTSWYYTNNCNDFLDLLRSTLGEVWTGEKTAEQAINGNIDALIAAHEGN